MISSDPPDNSPGEALSAASSKIKKALHQSDRNDEVQLIAVTKTRPAQDVRALVLAGQRIFGENRVQELLQKQRDLADILDLRQASEIEWHLIGHLQKNKVNAVVGHVALIQSVDNMELATRISQRAADLGIIQRILLQFNSSDESSKSGFIAEDLLVAADQLINMPSLRVEGVMTIGPFTENEQMIRECFRKTRELFYEVRERTNAPSEWSIISMGMSDDLEIAIAEGSNMVRIGRALFGERK